VFANLLNNAAKYTPECGRIDVEARSDGNDAVISLRDNGMGIDAESLPLVFDMFVQSGGDRSSARGGLGGLGIGLSLVRTLVRMHGGSVEARSAGRGKGSEFIVRLPRLVDATSDDREDASRPPVSSEIALKAGLAPDPLQHARRDVSAETAAARPMHASARRRILVVDDNHDVAETLAAFLRLEEHVVAVAHDASTALELFARERPHIVFLDIGLPEIDGCEVARRMRAAEADTRAADPGAAAARLIALTGWGQPEDRRRSFEAGFDDHLVKPIEPEVLLGLVNEASAAPARPEVVAVATESAIAPA
jgi:CheY-like chemotaxis protein